MSALRPEIWPLLHPASCPHAPTHSPHPKTITPSPPPPFLPSPQSCLSFFTPSSNLAVIRAHEFFQSATSAKLSASRRIQPHHCGADSTASLSRLIQPHRLGHSSHGATFCGHSARTVARSGRGKGTSARCLAVSLFTMRNNSCGPGHAFIVRARISRNRSLRSMTMICTWLSGGPSPQLPGEVAPWTTLCSKAHKCPT